MLIGALAELLTLGAVLPFLAIMSDPQKVSTYPMLRNTFVFLGWNDRNSILFPVTLVFIAAAVGCGAVRLLLTWAMHRLVFRLGHDLGVEVYRRTLYQPYSYHVENNTSVLISATNKVQDVIHGMLLPMMEGLVGLVVSAVILMALLVIDARIALFAFFGFGVMYLGVSYATRRRVKENGRIIAEAQTQRVKAIQEGLGGIRDVLIDQTQQVYLDKFEHVDSSFRSAQAQNVFFGAAPRYAIEACGIVLIATLALALSFQPGGLISSLPVLGALALGAQRLLPMLQLIYNGWTQTAGASESLDQVLDILEMPLGLDHAYAQRAQPLSFKREISVNSVTFRYIRGHSEVIRHVTLRVPKGTTVGFIGATGSGKSTLADLMMGLLQPSSGEVRVDDVLLSSKTVKSWQAQVAHVPQSIYLADTTIAENIALGVAPAQIDMQRVREAATRAELKDFVETLPDNYATDVGERGVRLSGGQRQRIGIARALYKQAKFLVFDEATSALDDKTEAAVMKAIQSLGNDLTILIVAHRLSTVRMCDTVFEIENGRVVAQGPADAILGRKPGQPELPKTDVDD